MTDDELEKEALLDDLWERCGGEVHETVDIWEYCDENDYEIKPVTDILTSGEAWDHIAYGISATQVWFHEEWEQ